jgi:predicted MFS family arabinose efflux permease
LVAAFGWRGCIVADAVSFALSALVLATLPILSPAPSPRAVASRLSLGALWNDLRVGWAFWAGSGAIRATVWLAVVAMAALGGFLAVIAVYARDQLGAGPRSMGFLLSSLGAGAILGAFAVARFTRAWPRLRVVCIGLAVMGAAFAMLVPGRPLQLAYVAIFTLGAAAATVIVPAQTLLQEETPPALLGRVTSSAVATIGLIQGASMLVAGPIATRVGFTPWLLSIAAVLTGCAIIGFLSLPGRARSSS